MILSAGLSPSASVAESLDPMFNFTGIFALSFANIPRER
jgi:hypothetical protein